MAVNLQKIDQKQEQAIVALLEYCPSKSGRGVPARKIGSNSTLTAIIVESWR
jgi:hypothetical protein